jgi:uncharacterized protein YgbK (DUF1537 family)
MRGVAAGAPRLRILADDLTGALDSATAFIGPRGVASVPVVFDARAEWPDGVVAAASTGSRDLPSEDLADALAPGWAWLAAADIAFKKVDSLLRGNTFEELRLAARSGHFDRLVLAPAFPQQGRLTVGGRLQVATATGVQDSGPTLAERLGGVGLPVDLPDVRDQADLIALARRLHEPAARRWLWCGSAGLAQALAEVLAGAWGEAGPDVEATPPVAPGPDGDIGTGPGPLLIVSASHQSVTRRQWARLQAACPQALRADAGDEAALHRALRSLAEAPRASGATALLDLSPRAMLSPADAAALRERQLQAIAALAPRPGRLVVIGGDTLLGLCQATGATGLQAGRGLRPGWGLARWQGGAWDGLLCHSRSGAFGGEEDLVELVERVGRARRVAPV